MIARSIFSDRFTLSLMLAMALHVAVLLMVSFSLGFDPRQIASDTLDVVLVNWRSETAPEQADFLAQSNQVGGGETNEKARPVSDVSGLLPNLAQGDALLDAVEAAPTPAEASLEQISQDESQHRITQEVTRVETPETPPISSAELMRQTQRMAQMQPELSRLAQFESKLPRREFISANTREFELASYMNAWVAKVERIGNFNYPDEAGAGDLVLTVGIRQDGSVDSIDLQRGSGIPELDQAAIHIVRLAAPYAPLPSHISERADVLHITRTWRFSSASRFSTSR